MCIHQVEEKKEEKKSEVTRSTIGLDVLYTTAYHFMPLCMCLHKGTNLHEQAVLSTNNIYNIIPFIFVAITR